MLKKRNISIIRICIQVIAFFLIPFLYVSTLGFLLSGIKFIFNTNVFFISVFDSLVIIGSTFLFGRFFCGWLCFFGFYNDILYLINQKIFKLKRVIIPYKLDKYLKLIKYMILLFLIVIITYNIIDISKISPWNAFANILDFNYVLSHYLIGLFILVGISILSFFIERFFCRYLCPLGAFFVLISYFRLIKTTKTDNECGPCRVCSIYCPMNIDLNKKGVSNGECIQCLNCVSVCPKSKMKVTFINQNLNKYLAASLVLSSIGISLYITNNISTETNIDDNKNINEEIPSDDENTNDNPIVNNKYIDGTYTGVGRGYQPNLNVSVTIKSDKITNIEILSNNETPKIANYAFNVIPSEIIDSQDTDVLVVSGATRTSEGIMEAVNNALEKALNQ